MTTRPAAVAALFALATTGCEVLFPFDGDDAPPDPGRWKAVAGGYTHTCAIDTADAVWCWGENGHGGLGNNGSIEATSPIAVPTGPSVALALGSAFTCALHADDTAWCWGTNARGALGIGTTETMRSPALVPDTWDAIAAGAEHACGLRAGALYCWGSNTSGQLGVGNQIDELSPARVGLDASWEEVTAGALHTCARKTDGTLWCWGGNDMGQLGQGDTGSPALTPIQVGTATDWGEFAAWAHHTCGIRTGDASAWCWGDNGYGETGNGSTGKTLEPARVDGPGGWTDLALGEAHTCGLRAGELWCWGENNYGALALEGSDGGPRIVPARSGAGTAWSALGAGGFHTCAIADGHLSCAGLDSTGQLGTGAGGRRPDPVPLGGGPWTAITTGFGGYSCAATETGERWCWGWNPYGQLGDGSATSRQVPHRTATGGTGDVRAGQFHTCEVRTDESLWCWGANSWGQLGVNDTTDRLAPVEVIPASQWRRVSAGIAHTCGIRNDRTLWCWGLNNTNQLGDNTATARSVPTSVATAGELRWLEIAVGANHSCGIKYDNTLWCWGLNEFGELGNGTMFPQPIPVLGFGDTVDRVAVGYRHTCIRRVSNRSVECWGRNDVGQLGDGTTTSRAAAEPVAGKHMWREISADLLSTCGIDTTSDALYCWGANDQGQVGDGTRVHRLVPTRVGDDAWTAVDPSGIHTCGITLTGDLQCWGANGAGAIGDGTAWRMTLGEVP